VHPLYKQRVVDSTAEDTVYGELFDAWWANAPHRVLRNKTLEEWDAAGRPPPGNRPGEGTTIGTRRTSTGEVQPWPRYATGMLTPDFEGDIEYAALLAGESCSVVNDIKPARVIVRDLVREAEAALAEAEQPAWAPKPPSRSTADKRARLYANQTRWNDRDAGL
jgi:NAD(P)H-dependent flavin oxidoreductase YrpB (nitropropane dioxygenase family)